MNGAADDARCELIARVEVSHYWLLLNLKLEHDLNLRSRTAASGPLPSATTVLAQHTHCCQTLSLTLSHGCHQAAAIHVVCTNTPHLQSSYHYCAPPRLYHPLCLPYNHQS